MLYHCTVRTCYLPSLINDEIIIVTFGNKRKIKQENVHKPFTYELILQIPNLIIKLAKGRAEFNVVGPVADVDLGVERRAGAASLIDSAEVVALVEPTTVAVVREVGAERAVSGRTTGRRLLYYVCDDRRW